MAQHDAGKEPLPRNENGGISSWRPRMRMLLALSAFVSVVLLGMSIFQPLMPTRAYATHTRAIVPATLPPTLTATPFPTPIPGLTLNQLHAQRDGCHLGSPNPLKNIIVDASSPGHVGPPPREVALTFDDGPGPDSTPAILTYLEQTHTPATFFVEGGFVAKSPDLLRREWKDGFALGVHTWDHKNLKYLAPRYYAHEFGDTLAVMKQVLGADACIWLFRPPYGDINGPAFDAAYSYGLTVVNWDVSGLDWLTPGAWKIASLVLQQVHPGAIILLHDGPDHREQTLHALPIILAGLKADGLKPVTLPNLLADAHFPSVDIPFEPILDPSVFPMSP